MVARATALPSASSRVRLGWSADLDDLFLFEAKRRVMKDRTVWSYLHSRPPRYRSLIRALRLFVQAHFGIGKRLRPRLTADRVPFSLTQYC